MSRLALVLILSFLLAACGDPTVKSNQMTETPEPLTYFEKSLRNKSTEPNLILLTVVDGRTGGKTQICTEAPTLIWAIRKEHNLPRNKSGYNNAVNIALGNEYRQYRFSNQEAIDSLVWQGWQEALSEVRTALDGLSKSELKEQLSHEGSDLHALCHRAKNTALYRNAVAMVLLEDDIHCVRGCVSGGLFPDPVISQDSHEDK